MSSKRPPARGLDNRVKSRLNQEKVLKALHRFGWLPVRQVHKACWPEDVTPRSAQRYLSQLLALKHITSKKGPDGSNVYALTALGARRMRTEFGIEATHDPEFHRRGEAAYEHRCLANDIVIWWSQQEPVASRGYYTENEIVLGRAPVKHAPEYMTDPKGKIPDALLAFQRPVTDTTPYSTLLAWVEVERGEKSGADHTHMCGALCDVLAFERRRWEIGTSSVLQSAVVVCPFECHEYKLAEGILQFLGVHKANYDSSYIINHICIWRPGSGDIIPLIEWIEDKPAMLALRNRLGLWWSSPKP